MNIFHNDRQNQKSASEMTEAELDEDAELSKRCGLTKEEASRPREAASSGGMMKLWNTRRYAVGQAIETVTRLAEDEQAWYERNRNLFGEKRASEARRLRTSQRFMEEELAKDKYPMWRYVSNIERDEETTLNPNERAGRISYLIGSVENVLRKEMAHAAQIAATSQFSAV